MASASKKTFKKRLLEEAESQLLEFLQLIGFIVSLKFGEILVGWLFKDDLVFGVFKKSYLFDAGDVGLIFCFCKRSGQRLLGRE